MATTGTYMYIYIYIHIHIYKCSQVEKGNYTFMAPDGAVSIKESLFWLWYLVSSPEECETPYCLQQHGHVGLVLVLDRVDSCFKVKCVSKCNKWNEIIAVRL